jgi:hypothetical protein
MNVVWVYNGVRLEARNDAGTLLYEWDNNAPSEIDLALLALALNQCRVVFRVLLSLGNKAIT